MWQNTTPVPNAVFDRWLRELKCAELKILLVIIRQTLGWKDNKSGTGRKKIDWIAGSQLREKTGSSPRAICSATEVLVRKNLIEVLGENGAFLDSPEKRKGKMKLFYPIAPTVNSPVDNPGKSDPATAKIAEDLRKKVIEVSASFAYNKINPTK